MIASEGPAIDTATANLAPIVDASSLAAGPFSPRIIDPSVPAGAQPDPTDVLLARAFWPWADLGAQNIPEHWLYMTRKVQGVIAQMAVQTPVGPKLLRADEAGRIAVTGDRVALPTLVTHPNTVNTQRISIPSGTEAVELKVLSQQIGGATTTVDFYGRTSGWHYYGPVVMTKVFTKIVIQVDAAQDIIADVIVTCAATVTDGSCMITLLKAVDEVTMLSNPGQEPQVGLLGLQTALSGGDTVKTSLFNTIGGQDVVGAVAGQTIYCISWFVQMVAAPAAGVFFLQDDAGLPAVRFNTDIAKPDTAIPLHGFAFAAGHKAQIAVAAGAPSNIAGHLLYVQK